MNLTKSEILRRSDAWWNGEQDDFLFGMAFYDSRVNAVTPTQQNVNDFSLSTKTLADGIIRKNENTSYHGDVCPHYNMDCFGPGVLAAYMGAELKNDTGNVWFKTNNPPLTELNLRIDYNNVYLNRLIEIADLVYEKKGEELVLGMPDLGGVIDVLSSFREGERLFYDMSDCPGAVTNALNAVCGNWLEIYTYLNGRLYDRQKAYTDWARVFSAAPCYVLQADFSFMIGEEDFAAYVLPTLKEQCRKIPRTLYHLDGEGEIRHLDALLSVKELNAVQWVCSPQNSMASKQAIEIYRRVLASGKRLQLRPTPLHEMDAVIQALGTTRNIAFMMQDFEKKDEDRILKIVEKIRSGAV